MPNKSFKKREEKLEAVHIGPLLWQHIENLTANNITVNHNPQVERHLT